MNFVFSTNSFWLGQVDFQSRDLLVAAVAIGLGINILYALFTSNRRCYELSSVQSMERNFGRLTTQLILFFLGGLCVMMGAFLVAQTTIHRKNMATDSVNVSELPLVGMNASSR